MRIVFKTYLSQSLDLGQLSGMFFLLAFNDSVMENRDVPFLYEITEGNGKRRRFYNEKDMKLT